PPLGARPAGQRQSGRGLRTEGVTAAPGSASSFHPSGKPRPAHHSPQEGESVRSRREAIAEVQAPAVAARAPRARAQRAAAPAEESAPKVRAPEREVPEGTVREGAVLEETAPEAAGAARECAAARARGRDPSGAEDRSQAPHGPSERRSLFRLRLKPSFRQLPHHLIDRKPAAIDSP